VVSAGADSDLEFPVTVSEPKWIVGATITIGAGSGSVLLSGDRFLFDARRSEHRAARATKSGKPIGSMPF
jgi:hypothetical protein